MRCVMRYTGRYTRIDIDRSQPIEVGSREGALHVVAETHWSLQY